MTKLKDFIFEALFFSSAVGLGLLYVLYIVVIICLFAASLCAIAAGMFSPIIALGNTALNGEAYCWWALLNFPIGVFGGMIGIAIAETMKDHSYWYRKIYDD